MSAVQPGTLFIVSTPIGNMKDTTLRALEILGSVDGVACEDTRETQKLLMHHQIRVPMISFHDHSGQGRLQGLIERLKDGQRIALVTDNGTPLVSDPGFTLVREALEQGIPVEPVPGPSACLAALVASGIPCEKFIFEGYLPQKAGGRRKTLEALREEKKTMVFYESPHRIVKTLEAMAEIFGERPACLAREITKKFEEFLRGNLKEILTEVLKRNKLGEMVIIVQGLRD